MKVKEIMETNVHYLTEDMDIQSVVLELYNSGVSGMPVINKDKEVVGMLTEADLLSKEKEPRLPSYVDILGNIIFIEGVQRYEEELKKIAAIKVGEIMTRKVMVVKEEDEAEKVAKIMVDGGVNRVPVVNNANRLVGIISRHDMLKLLL